MSLTVYYAPNTSATRILWALEELAVPYEKVRLDLAAGDQRKPAYKALNPNGKVPLLVVDGQPIFESLAILLHLGETYGVERGLFPASSLLRAEAFQWMSWIAVTFLEPLGRIMRAVGPYTPADKKDEAAAAAARIEAAALLPILEAALAKRPYILGEAFSLADLPIFGAALYAERMGVDLASAPQLRAYVERIKPRAAYQRAMQL